MPENIFHKYPLHGFNIRVRQKETDLLSQSSKKSPGQRKQGQIFGNEKSCVPLDTGRMQAISFQATAELWHETGSVGAGGGWGESKLNYHGACSPYGHSLSSVGTP